MIRAVYLILKVVLAYVWFLIIGTPLYALQFVYALTVNTLDEIMYIIKGPINE